MLVFVPTIYKIFPKIPEILGYQTGLLGNPSSS